MAAMETAGVGQKVAERYPDNGHASLPTGLPPVCKSPQRGHMAARKGIHPSHDDRPWPTMWVSPGPGCQQCWASLPLCGVFWAPPRTVVQFSVPLDQPVCHARPSSDKRVGLHPLLPPVEFFRTQPLSHPLLLPEERPAGKEFQQMFLLRLEHKLL